MELDETLHKLSGNKLMTTSVPSMRHYFRTSEYIRARRLAYDLLLVIHIGVGVFCGALLMGGPVAMDGHRYYEEFPSVMAWHNAVMEWGLYGGVFGGPMLGACFLLVARKKIGLSFLMPILITVALSLARHFSFLVIYGLKKDALSLDFLWINLINLLFSSFLGIPVGIVSWFLLHKFRRTFPYITSDGDQTIGRNDKIGNGAG